MKTVTYLFKSPMLDGESAEGVASAIAMIGGTIESPHAEHAPEGAWCACFRINGPAGVISHRRIVVEAVERCTGEVPVIARTQMQRVIPPAIHAGDVHFADRGMPERAQPSGPLSRVSE